MRHRSTYALLVIALVAMSCTDAPTTVPVRPYTGPGSQLTLADFIQQAIDDYLPRGFEEAVEARWSTVKLKKNSGDFAGAVKQLNTLSAWIDKKTPEITAPAGVTKAQAAALIVINMARWVYEGADADPQAVPTGDVAVEVVPAGAPLALVVPSQHASVTWDAGSTQEERVIVMLEDPETYPAQCQGPLPTQLCQYPLFYRVESFPHTRLTNPGRLGVCLVTTGDRRPIEYAADEPDEVGHHGPVGERLRLAHNAPANEDDRTPGGTVVGAIELLPLAETQSNLTNCNAPTGLNMGPIEKALHLAMGFVGKVISPKNAYAYDQGPEHDFSFFSNFNAVDPESQPDLVITGASAPPSGRGGTAIEVGYRVKNASRRIGGDATGTSGAGAAQLYLSADDEFDGEDTPIEGAFNAVPALAPGDSTPLFTHTVTLPATGGTHYVVVNVAQSEGGPLEVTEANNSDIRGVEVEDAFIGVWNGTLSPPGGGGGAQPATFIVTSRDGNSCTGEFRVAAAGDVTVTAYNVTRTLTSCNIDGTSLVASIDPWVNPNNNANRSDFAVTRTGNTLAGSATRWFPVIEGEGSAPEANPWSLSLTLGTTPTVNVPPPVTINLKASRANSTASTNTLY
jgi:hypothetical protein